MEEEVEPKEEEFIFKRLILPQKVKDEEYLTPTSTPTHLNQKSLLKKTPTNNTVTPSKNVLTTKKSFLDEENESEEVKQRMGLLQI